MLIFLTSMYVHIAVSFFFVDIFWEWKLNLAANLFKMTLFSVAVIFNLITKAFSAMQNFFYNLKSTISISWLTLF